MMNYKIPRGIIPNLLLCVFSLSALVACTNNIEPIQKQPTSISRTFLVSEQNISNGLINVVIEEFESVLLLTTDGDFGTLTKATLIDKGGEQFDLTKMAPRINRDSFSYIEVIRSTDSPNLFHLILLGGDGSYHWAQPFDVVIEDSKIKKVSFAKGR